MAPAAEGFEKDQQVHSIREGSELVVKAIAGPPEARAAAKALIEEVDFMLNELQGE